MGVKGAIGGRRMLRLFLRRFSDMIQELQGRLKLECSCGSSSGQKGIEWRRGWESGLHRWCGNG